MIRPPRRKNRFQGSPDTATTLSNPYAADGRRMRRRYACYAASCCAAIVVVIVMLASRSDSPQTTSSNKNWAKSYTKESKLTISDINADVTTYTHDGSGLSVVTVVPEDTSQDAVFGISFRTLPENDKGTAFVVQNAIQCGSEGFPIKDPFNQLKRGSLQTFMETTVEKDRSSYVYASRTLADFSNGVQVYLDAVFQPNFITANHDWIFRQEAWRLYVDDDQEVCLAGNAITQSKAREMEPNTAHDDVTYSAIFDGHPYSYVEKGDWRQVVTLSKTELKEYYEKYYHPSNAKAYCFGPQSFVDECLKLMAPYLAEYTADTSKSTDSKVDWVSLDEMDGTTSKFAYPSFKGVKDYRLAVAYIINDQPLDSITKMAWHVISELLIGTTSAIIPRVVVDNSLGDDAIGKFDTHLRQWMLTMGVSGIASVNDVDMALAAIDERLSDIAVDGFDDDAVTAALNKIKIRFLETSSENIPRGAQLFKTVMESWNYGGSPTTPLSYASAFADLEAEIANSGQEILLSLFKSKILNNKHRFVSQMTPSSQLITKYAAEEQTWLDNTDSWLTKESGLALLKEATTMQEVQDTADSQKELDKISSLSISDLRTTNYEIDKEVIEDVLESGITMLEHTVSNSNGIAYVDWAIEMSNVDFDDIVLLPLLCRLLMKAGTTVITGIQLQREIDTYTGGLTVVPLVEEVTATSDDNGYVVPSGKYMTTKLVVSTSCIAEGGCTDMFSIMKRIIFDSDIAQQAKVIELVKRMIDDMEDDVQTNAYKYTTTRVQSTYGIAGFIREQWQGFTQLINLRRTLISAEDNWDTLEERLTKMIQAIRKGNRNGMVLSITGDSSSISELATGLNVFLKTLLPTATQTSKFPDHFTNQHPWYTVGMNRMSDEVSLEGDNEAFLAPTTVNAVAKGGRLFEEGESVNGYDLVVLRYIAGFYLYDELHLSRGAGQVWAVVDVDTGSVVFQSDEDPNIVDSLEVYEGAAAWVERQIGGLSSLPVEARGAVIGAIGALDGTALQPSRVGITSMTRYLKGETSETRQQYRTEILESSVSKFEAFIDTLGGWGSPDVAVVTNEAQYTKARSEGLSLKQCNITSLSC